VIGTLELRRDVGTFELCIAFASLRGVSTARPVNRRAPCMNYVTAKFIKDC
jgi:hypothetical protein